MSLESLIKAGWFDKPKDHEPKPLWHNVLSVMGFIMIVPFVLSFAAIPLAAQMMAIIWSEQFCEEKKITGYAEFPIVIVAFILSCVYTASYWYFLNKLFFK